VNELGAYVSLLHNGCSTVYAAAESGDEHVVRCLLNECGADVSQPNTCGSTALHVAASKGHEHVVRCLVKECGADIDQANNNGVTPLTVAVADKHTKIAVWLTRHGADSQVSHPHGGTAANMSKILGAPAEQTAYLEARTHCANPGCDGAGHRRCAGCAVIQYCHKTCQIAHWPAHKAECKRRKGV
jgi:ankyrin repeat protein